MTVLVCSLKVDTPQVIKPGIYTTVRFPFGALEPYDVHRMHQVAQSDGHTVEAWREDDRAGLIWPAADGWGVLTAMAQWEAGGYRELGARLVRDPLDLTTGWDSTATDERPPSPGRQRSTYQHQMFVHPKTPIALQVCHDDLTPRKLTLAEFKLAIHPEV
ncbi:hypothetical protein AB0I66_21715 [Streptomyces sp. NPDC050439]|uniref:hypothetical protein n=1 Tax=unclassified Streptomyces TaxID=2593676 RepID=UPI003447CE6C